ncbi:MAG: hypothetical protein OHK0032_12620 [Thermodesulfovibrionales bacterium]
MAKRICQRFTKRLETIFASGGMRFTGITSDLSAGGLFLRTQHGLVPGSFLDIEIYLPENKVCRLKGIVRRTIKTPLTTLKNGMGIELIERDENYLEFLRKFVTGTEKIEEAPLEPDTTGNSELETEDKKQESVFEEKKTESTGRPIPETIIITCQNCNVKNRVLREKLSIGPKCGKCGTVLNITDTG